MFSVMDSALDAVDARDLLDEASLAIREADLHRRTGRVVDLIGLIVEATGLEAEVGEVCTIETGRGRADRARRGRGLPRRPHAADAARRRRRASARARSVIASGQPLKVDVSDALLGRALDGLGRPLDGKGPIPDTQWRPAEAAPPDPLSRPRIDERVSLGVRALDALVPCGRGQRLGIFAGSGVGKSSLLGMIARSTSEEINVICLVGERGREVLEFMQRDLGAEGLARSVVVCATSDQPALVRLKAAFTATAIAEYFRDQGRNVMLMMDSVTRFAMAQREVGLAVGEPPATRGYTPSRVRDAAEAARARGHVAVRLDHRALHGARRRRRHERADRRRRPRHPRRPHRPLPPPRARGPLPRDRRARVRLPPRRRDRHARGARRRQRGPQADGDLQGEGRPDLDRRLPARLGSRDRRRHRGPRPDRRLPHQGVTEPSTAEEADQTLAQLATLGGTFEAPVARRRSPVGSWCRPAQQGGMPLHNAIPPLHIPS